MREEATTQKDPATGINPAGSPRLPWLVTSVQALPGYRLRVQFDDGLEGTADLSALVRSPNAGVFAALADEALFNEAFIEYGAVTWPGEIDIAPDAMHAEIQKSGEWIILP
ncbi:MAG: DUF2442 domain-containing protein [Rhodomicrobium sp.]